VCAIYQSKKINVVFSLPLALANGLQILSAQALAKIICMAKANCLFFIRWLKPTAMNKANGNDLKNNIFGASKYLNYVLRKVMGTLGFCNKKQTAIFNKRN
jgi:hypothetical protein